MKRGIGPAVLQESTSVLAPRSDWVSTRATRAWQGTKPKGSGDGETDLR